MSVKPLNAAIRFELEGYELPTEGLLGRHSAGVGFLRAAVQGRGEGPVAGYGPRAKTGGEFAQQVRAIDPAVETRWLRADNFLELNAAGVCYRPDPALGAEAMLRLRAGPARYCLTGVTHTLSTGRMADAIADLLVAPLMPWDAVICTSQAALGVIKTILEEQASYLEWRLGRGAAALWPQLPVIPLGVHCEDFAFTDAQRRQARLALGLAEDETALLYAGRLAFADKAHPFAMFLAAQRSAERTGRKLALVLAGRFLNQDVEAAFRDGLAKICPSVRPVIVDGGQAEAYRQAWAAADLFVSAADSIQETFGLTPIEAMAAGLPVLVSDWNGYRETVRDGIDGFRIPTRAPAPGAGVHLASQHEADVIGHVRFSWGSAVSTSVDMQVFVERMSALIADPDLRRRMGEAGRLRARQAYDWAGVYVRYQELWGELNNRRRAVARHPELLERVVTAPKAAASRQDPFAMFGHYPTVHISGETRLSRAAGDPVEQFRTRSALFPEVGVSEAEVAALAARLDAGELSVAELATALGWTVEVAVRKAATLAKLDVLDLKTGTT